MKSLQLPSGVYKAAKDGTEHDMRFLFCAASICYVLNDWSGMDIDKAVTFIKNSIVGVPVFCQTQYIKENMNTCRNTKNYTSR